MRKFLTSFLLTNLPDGYNYLITITNHLVRGCLPDGLPYPYQIYYQPDFKTLYLFVCLLFTLFYYLVSTTLVLIKLF